MALESVWPAPRKQNPPRISRLDPFKATIDEILREDLDAPRKQRHTVRRVFDRLIDEHDAQGVTYSMVRAYIAGRRPEIRVEEGRGPPQAFVPQTHRPADETEVDFGDVWIHLDGVSTKVFLFSLRLSFSGKAVHKIFASCGQEAFLEGHVHALQVAGRRAAREGPLRQSAGRGQPGFGVYPGSGGKPLLDGVPVAFLDQQFLLQSRHRGRP